MDVYTTLLIILIIYSIILFIDRFYKTCAHYPYIQFLKGTGLEVKFLQIKWQTTALNRTFLRWGSGHSSFFNLWFKTGTYVTLILFPIAILMLIVTIFQMFFKRSTTSSVMQPIIPGVNLPDSELGYYSLMLVICGIVHEFGHALAAVREDVHLVNTGINILFILPIVYVKLNTEDIQKLNPYKSLKIFCAGAWHNIVLALVAYILYLILPILFTSLFIINKGVIVTNVDKHSPLKGNNGLFAGDTIIKINDCSLSDYNSWYDCIQKAKIHNPGFCVTADIINLLDETSYVNHIANDVVNCCSADKTSSICFEYIEHNDGIVEIPQHSCLPIRPLIEKSLKFCDSDLPCPTNLHCVKPLLNNNTSILKIACLHKTVIYMGHPYDLGTIEISQYIPKFKYITSQIPDVLEKQLMYIIIFSLGFAVINVIPCLAMDGQHITNSVLNLIFGTKTENSKTLATVSLCMCLCGAILLFCLTIHTIWVNMPFLK